MPPPKGCTYLLTHFNHGVFIGDDGKQCSLSKPTNHLPWNIFFTSCNACCLTVNQTKDITRIIWYLYVYANQAPSAYPTTDHHQADSLWNPGQTSQETGDACWCTTYYRVNFRLVIGAVPFDVTNKRSCSLILYIITSMPRRWKRTTLNRAESGSLTR